jgi:hypothetical protein
VPGGVQHHRRTCVDEALDRGGLEPGGDPGLAVCPDDSVGVPVGDIRHDARNGEHGRCGGEANGAVDAARQGCGRVIVGQWVAVGAEPAAECWRAVEGYLEDVIPLASAKHASKEGAVQAAVSVFSTDERVMVDREVALSFKDTSTKARIFEEITAPYLEVVKTVAEVPGQHPTSFGGECDLLAVDAHGRLLAVEIKPRNVSSIAWAGIQATIYAELFTRWLRSPRSAAVDQPEVIIRDMLDQRTRLGLASPNRAALPDEPEVVPVVAIQRNSREVFLDRLRSLHRTTVDSPGCAGTNLEVYEVSMTGRLQRLAL